MPANLKKIAQFFLQTLVPNSKFNSASPNSDQSLLFPDFLAAVMDRVAKYNGDHAGQDVTFTETYRSNVLQEKYFNDGASKIKANGMHHYGIAADSIFIIGGKKTYKGDIVGLRKAYSTGGLTVLGMWDPLHVQYITVAEQPALRAAVVDALTAFQKANGLPQTGVPDAATIAMAKQKFGG